MLASLHGQQFNRGFPYLATHIFDKDKQQEYKGDMKELAGELILVEGLPAAKQW